LSNLDEGTEYFWRVVGVNVIGKGDWSEIRSFTTHTLSPPEQVMLTAPPDSAKSVFPIVNFMWEAVTDTPAQYHLEVSQTGNFEGEQVSYTTSRNNHTVGPLSGRKQYYWRVQAENSAGASPWSVTFTFETAPHSSPGKITLVAPEHRAVKDTNVVTFTWRGREGVDNYMLELAKDEAQGLTALPFGHEALERLQALRSEVFQDQVLPGDSAELIREARTQRATAQ
jgi:hypothetical protein